MRAESSFSLPMNRTKTSAHNCCVDRSRDFAWNAGTPFSFLFGIRRRQRRRQLESNVSRVAVAFAGTREWRRPFKKTASVMEIERITNYARARARTYVTIASVLAICTTIFGDDDRERRDKEGCRRTRLRRAAGMVTRPRCTMEI